MAYSTPFSDPLKQEKVDAAKKESQTIFDKRNKELYSLNRAFAGCFSTDDGKKVLEFLKANTLDAATWSAKIVADAGLEAATANGFAREGQNALVRDILLRIETAGNAQNPDYYSNKPQDIS
jgi:hypothetical protein